MTTETTTDTVEDTADKIRAGLKGNEAETDTDTDTDDNSGEGEPKPKTEEKPKISDNEAKLLKEVMKHKEAAKKAAADLAAMKANVDGLDIEAVRQMLADKEKAEDEALEKKGEFDRLLAKQREAAEAKVAAEKKRADEAEAATAKLLKQIEDLTVGSSFSNSKFVTEKLTLTPNKAKALYQSHFEFVDGKQVAYDKPRGEADRTMIVDATGEAVDFEAAIEAIINSDPDKDYLLKAPTRAGAGSKPSVEKPAKVPEFADTTDKIAAGLDAFIKASTKK